MLELAGGVVGVDAVGLPLGISPADVADDATLVLRLSVLQPLISAPPTINTSTRIGVAGMPVIVMCALAVCHCRATGPGARTKARMRNNSTTALRLPATPLSRFLNNQIPRPEALRPRLAAGLPLIYATG